MPSTIFPVDDGSLSMDALASTLSTHEQDNQRVLVTLSVDSANKRNLGGFDPQPYGVTLGLLEIVATGAAATDAATKIQSNNTIYISGTLTAVDVYRRPV